MREYGKKEIATLRSGIGQPFWATLKSIFEDQMAELADKILNDDALHEKISLTKRELAIMLYQWKKEALNTPESVIKSIEEGKKTAVEFDPYPKDFKDLVDMV